MKLKMMPLAIAFALLTFAACDKDDDNQDLVNSTDMDFVMKAAMSNYTEISAAKLADSISTDPDIKSFAQEMITDHTKAQDSLKVVAGEVGLYAPDSMDAEHVQMAAMLRTMSGRAFDSAYMHGQVADHETTVALFQNEDAYGNNAAIRDYEARYIGKIQMHLVMADSLAAQY